jgi:sialate O-acetylesterase
MFVAEKRPGAKRAGLEAVKDFDQSWQVSSEKYTLLTSAMGYVFGLRLHQHLNIPIGLIDTNKSGSPIETWMSAEALKAAGLKAEADSHYNGNIFPVQKFAIKGVIWYQGESNAMSVESSIAYGRTFPTMIESWRKEWGQGDFPFLYVQLAGWDWNESVRRNWPLLRESQDKALALPNVGAALAIDKGARRNIHPIHKIIVSVRLVLAARKHAYDEDLIYSGPMYKSHEVRGGKVEVVFNHVGGGLIKKAFQIEDVKTTSAKLEGFELSADGHSYVPAEATIQGDQVVVSSDAVKSPKHVRYAWTGFPKANLFNKGDLPAHPFRTDDHVPQSPVEQKKPKSAPRKKK